MVCPYPVAPFPNSAVAIWPVMTSNGTELAYAVATPVARLVDLHRLSRNKHRVYHFPEHSHKPLEQRHSNAGMKYIQFYHSQ